MFISQTVPEPQSELLWHDSEMQLDDGPPSADWPAPKHWNPSGQPAFVVQVRASAVIAKDAPMRQHAIPMTPATLECERIGLPPFLSFALRVYYGLPPLEALDRERGIDGREVFGIRAEHRPASCSAI